MSAHAEVLLHLVDALPDRLRAKRRVTYHRLPCRTVLNRNPNPRHPFYWTINPYRGCELGCTYCFARYTHTFMDHAGPLDFEREIYAKVRAPEVLARTVEPADLAGRPVAIGTATDPYQPAERRFGITRRLLEVLAGCPTLELSITTKSDLVLRDLDLLLAIGRTRPLAVHLSLITTDRRLARLLEPGAPMPERRLDTVAALRRAGVHAGLFVMPILPRITDGEAALDRLFAAARAAGASFAAASLLHLRRAPRARFFPCLAEHFPEHEGWYRRAYGRSAYLRGPARDVILARVRGIRARHGFAGGAPLCPGPPAGGAPAPRAPAQLLLPWG